MHGDHHNETEIVAHKISTAQNTCAESFEVKKAETRIVRRVKYTKNETNII